MVGCPLDSKCMSKLVYIMRNPKHLKKARVMVLPYLHQKRLYLNRKKMNTEYFYTSIAQEIPSYFKHMISNDEYQSLKQQKSIVSVNLTESKYYVYSARGILRNRVKFNHIIREYGKIVEVSPDGSNYLLLNETKEGVPLVSLFHLTEFEFLFIKKFNPLEEL